MRVSLPEQVWLELKPAGFGSRGLAYITDFTLRWTVIAAVALVIFLLFQQVTPGNTVLGDFIRRAVSGETSRQMALHILAIFGIILFLVEWSYPVYFEVLHQGVTPGKKVFGLRVVDEQGLPIGFQMSAIRTLLLVVDFLPAFGFVAFIAMLFNKRSLRIGDIVAGTQVIYEAEETYPMPAIDPTKKHRETMVLPLQMYNLLEAYLKRRSYFTAAAQHGLKTLLLRALTPHLKPVFIEQANTANLGGGWFEEVFISSVPDKATYANT